MAECTAVMAEWTNGRKDQDDKMTARETAIRAHVCLEKTGF